MVKLAIIMIIHPGEVIVLLLLMPLDNIDIAIFIIDEILSQKLTIFVDIMAVCLIVLCSQQMISLIPMLIHELTSVIDMFLDSLQIGVFAVVLVVMALQSNHCGLIDVHCILTLSNGIWNIYF